MRRFIVGALACVGALVVLLFVIAGGLWLWAAERGPRIGEGTVLTFDFTDALPDTPDNRGISELLFPRAPSLADALGAIERAGDDPRIRGLVARIGDSTMAVAQVQELRDAIAAFRAKGKRAVAYADTFGELGSGTSSYYLAAAFDEIWLQPMGIVGLVGLRVEMPYLRATLDALGIVPDFEHREEYKDAANVLTETAMTEPERVEWQALIDSIFGQVLDGIAADRKIDKDALKALVDRAPLTTEEALKAHLVDHLGDREDAIASLGSDAVPLSASRYLDEVGAPHQSGPTIALIYATGLMARGSGGNPLTGSSVLGADAVTRAFHLAQIDPAVRAILFRVDSQGGSAVAAETIWNAVRRARDAGKPVIVSMGDVAGSGGYYIAAPADKIVAEPATLTGAIGVVAGKLVLGGFLHKLDANFGSVAAGANAGIESAMEDFSPAERARFEAVLDATYAGFKERVATGRKLSADAVEAVAKGRVWSGADAKANGLVDALGGFDAALALAKDAAAIPASEDVTLKPYPAPQSELSIIVRRIMGGDDDDDGDADEIVPRQSLALVRASLDRLAVLLASHGALVMPPVVVK